MWSNKLYSICGAHVEPSGAPKAGPMHHQAQRVDHFFNRPAKAHHEQTRVAI